MTSQHDERLFGHAPSGSHSWFSHCCRQWLGDATWIWPVEGQVSISMRHFKVSLASHWVFFRRARRRIISTPHQLPQSYTIFHICLPVIPSDFFSSDVFHAHCGSAAVPKQMDTDVCKLRVRSHAEPAFADSAFSLFFCGGALLMCIEQ